MYSGSLSVAALSGEFDLQSTLESAQSFLWRRLDGEIYEETTPYGGHEWYYTVVDDDVTEAILRERPYEEAHETLQSFPGVGPKIADCVSLFALNHLQAVPIDTWTRRLIEQYFPNVASGSYDATAIAFRERFGKYVGYAQTYLHHYERS